MIERNRERERERERERKREREKQEDRIRESGLRGTRFRKGDRGGRHDEIKR